MQLCLKSNSQNPRVIFFYLVKVCVLAILYHLAARLGLMMAYVQVNTSPVWPPTGIALAFLLTFGCHYWPGVSLGVLLGSLLTGAPPSVAIGMSIGNTLEAWSGAYVLKRVFVFHNKLDRVQDVVILALVAGFSTAISATIGTSTLLLAGSIGNEYPIIWLTWWIGNLLGALVVTPAFLTWMSPLSFSRNKRLYLEGSLLIVLLVAITWYVFGSRPYANVLHQAMIYVIFPFVIWAALRLGQRGAATVVLLVSSIAIFGTVHGMGPFSQESKNDSLVMLQTFMGVVSLTSLILAAATIERRKAIEALHQRVSDLVILNDSSRSFLDYSDQSRIYSTICQLAVTRLGADAAWVETIARDECENRITAAYGTSIEIIPELKKIWNNIGETLEEVVVKGLDDLPPSHWSIANPYYSYAAFPLSFGNKNIGHLCLLSRNKGFFTQERQLLIQSFSNLAAAAIQNAWLVEEVHQGNKRLHALSQRLMKALEEERLHLSRELHDESAQLLSALMVQLGMLEREKEFPEILAERIVELKRLANIIHENLRQLAVNLRPASLDHLGLVKTLRQYLDDFSRQYGLQIDFEVVGIKDTRLPIEIETAIFRIIQESLTNVVRHAHASRVDVLITYQKDRVIAIVEDDGVGFTPIEVLGTEHLGLFGMRERVEMLGGQLVVESFPGKGTTVKAEVPYHD